MAKLRIKADKDLSELERFGFEPRCCDEYEEYVLTFDYGYANSVEIYIDAITREVCIEITSLNEDCRFYPTHILWLLFDLIQADLVEKVEGGE